MTWMHIAETVAAVAVVAVFLLASIVYMAMCEIMAQDEILEDYVETEMRIW